MPTQGQTPSGAKPGPPRDSDQLDGHASCVSATAGAALAYAKVGWHVFPCKANKRPYTEHGFKDATTDPAQIEAWWRRWPSAQIGVACGASGLVVVDTDIDEKKGLDGEAALAAHVGPDPIDAILEATTPRGGRHRFYANANGDFGTASGILDGVDVRGDGGYVIVPSPSSPDREWVIGDPIDGDELEPPPPCIESLLRRRERPASSRTKGKMAPAGTASDARLAEVRSALDSIDPTCGRSEWLQAIYATHAALDADERGAELVEGWSSGAALYDHLTKTGQYRRGEATKAYGKATLPCQDDGNQRINAETLFHMAREAGWTVSAEIEARRAPSNASLPPLATKKTLDGAGEADPFAGCWFPLNEDWTEQKPPPERWLVRESAAFGTPGDGLLARGIVALIAGPGGVGKTEIACGLGIAIATGGLWLDRFPVDDVAGRVLILAAEEDEAEMRRRIHRYTRRLPPEKRALLWDRIVVMPMHARDVATLSRESQWAGPQRAAFAAALHGRLVKEAGSDGWAAVIAGPLSRLAGVDIDSNNENATALVQALESLTKVPGNPTVLVDCHTPAATRKRDQKIDDTRPRGPTGLSDGVRWVAALHRPLRQGPIEFAVIKSNRTKDDAPVVLLERREDGLLRCTGAAPTHEERQATRNEEKAKRDQEDMESRVDAVVAAIKEIHDEGSEPLARETVAEWARGTITKNRAAFDLAVQRKLIVRAGGTAGRPLYTPAYAAEPTDSLIPSDTSDRQGGGESPPYPPDATRRDADAPSQHVDSRRPTESDATRRDEPAPGPKELEDMVLPGLDAEPPKQPKNRKKKAKKRRRSK